MDKKTVLYELEIIQKKHAGFLNPADVVEYAKNPKTELHSKFEWNDKKAGYQYRLEQARRIIRLQLTIIKNGNNSEHKTRLFVSLEDNRRNDDGKNGYYSIVDVLNDSDLTEMLLEQAKKDMIYFKQKYNSLSILAKVFESMELFIIEK